MCGIGGIMFFDDPAPDVARRTADRLERALRHRGPDGGGTWLSPAGSTPVVAFAHRRLAILDLTDAAAQPMASDHGAITYNGEIYNYAVLGAELEASGVRLRSRSDTEVALRAVEQRGRQAVTGFDGMFAFGYWSLADRQLTLARDRFGIKPLYYFQGDRHFVFASEIGALLATGLVPRRLDLESLHWYLAYQTVPAPRTLIQGVRLLEPGHTLRVAADGSTELSRYWYLLDAAAGARDVAPDEARRQTTRLLEEAVASHLVSDVPVGLFLSGGIDSAALAALAALLADAGRRPRSFTLGFTEPEYDESGAAAEVASHFGLDHTTLRCTADEVLGQLPAALAAADHPSGDGINTYLVSQAVRRHGVKVVLSGLGGDEIFGGYPSFRRLSRILGAGAAWGRTPAVVRQAAAGALRTFGGESVAFGKAAAVAESEGSLASLWPVTRRVFAAPECAALLGRGRRQGEPGADPYERLLGAAFREAPGARGWARISYAESRAYMHDVLLRDTDQMSMAHGVEVRVPLLDHRLAEYVVGLPDAIKQAGGGSKPLLVSALPRPLPAGIAARAKRGFTLPFERWMRGPLRGFSEHALGPAGLEGREVFDRAALRSVWQRFLDGNRGMTWSRVWTLIALSAWLQRHDIDGGGAS